MAEAPDALGERITSGGGSGGDRLGGGEEQPLAALFCVFDGHCGRLAAEQVATPLAVTTSAWLQGQSWIR